MTPSMVVGGVRQAVTLRQVSFPLTPMLGLLSGLVMRLEHAL